MSSIDLNHIQFNQYSDVIYKLNEKHLNLSNFVSRFGGLCDLICNRILLDDSLGKGKDLNFLKDRVTVERIDTEQIKSSHLLDVHSLFHRALAFLMGIYPENIFSCFDQWQLVEKSQERSFVRRVKLKQGLKNIADETTLKLEIFSRNLFSFSGHSLLIKKISNDNYIFFDPDCGEHRGLSFAALSDKIDDQLNILGGKDIYITRGDHYLKRLKELS